MPPRINEALAFAGQIRDQPHARVISPGLEVLEYLPNLCRQTDAGGKLIPDAYLAALALEHGCEVVSTDKDFRRFPGLRWRHPLN